MQLPKIRDIVSKLVITKLALTRNQGYNAAQKDLDKKYSSNQVKFTNLEAKGSTCHARYQATDKDPYRIRENMQITKIKDTNQLYLQFSVIILDLESRKLY